MATKDSSVMDMTGPGDATTEVSNSAQEPLVGNGEAMSVGTPAEEGSAEADVAARTRRTRGPALSIDEKRKKVETWLTLRANGGTNTKIAQLVNLSYATFLKYQKEIDALDQGVKSEVKGKVTNTGLRTPDAKHSWDNYVIELDVRTLVASNRRAVINALMIGKHEAVKKAILDLIEG